MFLIFFSKEHVFPTIFKEYYMFQTRAHIFHCNLRKEHYAFTLFVLKSTIVCALYL